MFEEEEKEKDEIEEPDLFGVGPSVEDDEVEKIDDLEELEDDEAYMSEFDDSDNF